MCYNVYLTCYNVNLLHFSDVNECETSLYRDCDVIKEECENSLDHDCDVIKEECVNTLGSFDCVWKAGFYRGNANVCQSKYCCNSNVCQSK